MGRAVAVMLAAVMLAAACAADVPLYDRLPEDSVRAVEGGWLIEEWPAVARRAYSGDTQLGLPPRFHDRPALRGLELPTAIRFAPDGRVFVAEQRGVIKVFPSTEGGEAVIVADLRDRVFSFSQMGLLGIDLDPDFATNPYIYLSYTHDAPIGGQAPVYGGDVDELDVCPDNDELRCHVSGRVSRLLVGPDGRAGPEQVLVEDWCHDGGHSLGTVLIGPDGALYAGAGDGAGPNVVEYGQSGQPPNMCGDPPVAVGEVPSPPTAEGGSLRSQDLRTREDPVGLAGTIMRVDRATGAALADNPLAGDADENARRIVAYGLRNPYRFTFRPGSREIWIADVGWEGHEEINVLVDTLAGPVPNYGWPCYEGPFRQPLWEEAGFDICTALYADQRDLVMPVLSLAHVRGDEGSCGSSGNVLSGIAFYDGASFPAEYAGALFLADVNRGCIWVARAGDDGWPDFLTIRQFRTGARPVDLQVGPDGALYYADHPSGQIRRIQYYAANQPPRARLRASTQSGPAPLTVTIHAARSTDADDDVLTYAWDTDEDLVFDDGTADRVTLTFTEPGRPLVRVRVTDTHGEWSETQIRITVEAPPP